MSYNGSGTFNINTAGQPVVTGTVISSTAFNALTADLATGLSTAITKNGQTTVTANIPFNNFKLTGIGVATATGDALSYGQAATVTSLVASTSITDSGLTSGRLTYASTGGLLADSASLTWDGSYLTAASIKDTALTSGRVTYAGASGLLQDSANLTFNGTTLTAAGFSGPLNGTVGATTPSTGAFTTLSATGVISGTNNAAKQAVFSGYSEFDAAAGTDLATIWLGSQTAHGVLQYTTAGHVFIDNTYNSTSGHIKLRVKTGGTPVTVLDVADTGLAVTGTLDATGAIKSTGANLANEASAVKLSYEGSSLSAITAYGADASTAGAFQIASKSSNGSVSGTVLSAKAAQTLALEGASRTTGTGIAFPATQFASSDANTLDDYEEGTWTPTQGAGLTVVGTFSSSGTYTKIGRSVTIFGTVSGSTSVAVAASNTVFCAGLPAAISSTSNAYPGLALNNSTTASMPVQVTSTTIYAAGTMAATTNITFSATYFV
jgi:hypothetical protein